MLSHEANKYFKKKGTANIYWNKILFLKQDFCKTILIFI